MSKVIGLHRDPIPVESVAMFGRTKSGVIINDLRSDFELACAAADHEDFFIFVRDDLLTCMELHICLSSMPTSSPCQKYFCLRTKSMLSLNMMPCLTGLTLVPGALPQYYLFFGSSLCSCDNNVLPKALGYCMGARSFLRARRP